MGDRSWRDRSSDLNQSLVREWLKEQNINVIIATDWSIQDDVTAWVGGTTSWFFSGQLPEVEDLAATGRNPRPLVMLWCG
jgi:hypothetical protein